MEGNRARRFGVVSRLAGLGALTALLLVLVGPAALADDYSGEYTGNGTLCEPLNGGTCVPIQADITVDSSGQFDAHGLSGSVDSSGTVTGSYDDGSGNVFPVSGSVSGSSMTLHAQKGSAYADWTLTRSFLGTSIPTTLIIWSVVVLLGFVVLLAAINAAGTGPLASKIRRGGRVQFETKHPAQYRDPKLKDDGASAQANIEAAAKNRPVKRSKYRDGASRGPGRSTRLCKDMLRGMLSLSERFQFRVSEIAGGVHADHSSHYRGAAFDVVAVDGKAVTDPECHWREFVAAARALRPPPRILDPDNEPVHHKGHVHLQWACGRPESPAPAPSPRPAAQPASTPAGLDASEGSEQTV